jgi:serine/threonine protein kinase
LSREASAGLRSFHRSTGESLRGPGAAAHPRAAPDQSYPQFAFGIVLYEILEGRRPFEGASLASIVGAVLHDSPPPLRRLRPDVPRDLEEIVLRCLEGDAPRALRDPRERPAVPEESGG